MLQLNSVVWPFIPDIRPRRNPQFSARDSDPRFLPRRLTWSHTSSPNRKARAHLAVISVTDCGWPT